MVSNVSLDGAGSGWTLSTTVRTGMSDASGAKLATAKAALVLPMSTAATVARDALGMALGQQCGRFQAGGCDLL